MVQEQSTLILLKMEEAAEGNLVVNPFERDEAHVEDEPSDKTLFFFLMNSVFTDLFSRQAFSSFWFC